MRKILFVIDSLNSGGAEKSLISLLSMLDFKKYEVDLLMFSQEGLYLPLLPKKVNVLDVPNFIKKQSLGLRSMFKNGNLKGIYYRIKRSIYLRNPYYKRKFHTSQINWKSISNGIDELESIYDVAIAYSQGSPTYFVGEKVKADKKLCWINTDYKIACYNKQFDENYYEQFDNIITVSDYNNKVFIEEMPIAEEKTCVVYDILSPNLIKRMATEGNGFHDNFNGLKILTIGRLVEAKGYDMAIEACYMLKKHGYKFKWYVIGEGNIENKLKKMVREFELEDTFIFLGTFHNPYTLLNQCDIYVQPSRFEGFGLAIAEARILQKPIVATNFPIVHNQLINGQNGIIVNMNSEGVYKGIKQLIENKNLRDNICLRLRNEKVGTEEEIYKVNLLLESS
ncbi:glycosyltransferase [Metabacillus sediminilitoris]|uniref:Glycosyltransferase n=1 Tax=Metabacillus sediminilitoris TaxID=2567941 RepID=A0A4S4C4F9_9BACI|nr:glycosyltransferase [Metabacillus sediminilitoris]QGQ47217.1 glycosyltransferase [Metabacillus sediminilitoris]THF80561.1 glycosyltransferase [Metabacillus sediminilitoris]